MLDDFFIRALIAGVGLALVAAPLGCFIVWRRMAYFGDTMAHSALLGVALAFFFEVDVTISVFLLAAVISIALMVLEKRGALSTDALLGLLSHSTLALGLVLVSVMSWLRIDLMGVLFGDILAVSKPDLLVIGLGGAAVLGLFAFLWRPLLAATLSTEVAEAEGLNPDRSRLLFMLMMAAVIAVAIKIVGVLLITALLIIPAATARRFAATPESMAVMAAVIGAAGVVLGLGGSLQFDTPSGPSIVVAALAIFLGAFALPQYSAAK